MIGLFRNIGNRLKNNEAVKSEVEPQLEVQAVHTEEVLPHEQTQDNGGVIMRQERIESIIQQRKPLAERVFGVRERLGQALDQFERFQVLYRSTLQDKEVA